MSLRLKSGLGLALLLLSPALVAQQTGPPPAHDYNAELTSLEQEFQKAQEEFYKNFHEGMSDQEINALLQDKAKNPALSYSARFEDLAQRAKGTDAAVGAWIYVLQMDSSGERAGPILDTLVKDYIASPALSKVAEHLRYGWYPIGADKAETALRTMQEQSPHDGVRAASAFILASILMEQEGREADARQLFNLVKEKYPDSPYGQQADSFLFELENLQVGKTAPDFTVTDENGATFHLSDYRGKVVVLDFWGFW